ncbi:protein of unknown function [Streptococcus sanguinis]|uniref:Uncharacterized protein n=1 Tax=Streptococcus sanguinis TaxID=1305 RepID=A0A0B7GPL8_STRSA|nr:protein of unknown function [Streptococcus sanguinis]
MNITKIKKKLSVVGVFPLYTEFFVYNFFYFSCNYAMIEKNYIILLKLGFFNSYLMM